MSGQDDNYVMVDRRSCTIYKQSVCDVHIELIKRFSNIYTTNVYTTNRMHDIPEVGDLDA